MKPKAPKAAKKSTKPKKPARVTKKSQTGSRRQVWNGTRTYTKGGLVKSQLIKNKNGRIVSKKAASSKHNTTNKWMAACKQARAALNITGFVTMNKGAQGVALYKKTKELYTNQTPQ